MPKVNIYNQKGESIGEIELSNKIFGIKINESLIHQAVVAQTSNQRQVLAHTKGRSEVRGGGKKPWAQKGTGRARAGSSRSPLWIGGGVTFGPTKERNFKKDINKKMKQKAIFMVLSDRLSSGNLLVIEKIELIDYKTRVFNGIINILENIIFKNNKGTIKENKKDNKKSLLVINDRKDEKVKYSSRNLKGVEVINFNNINIVDLLKYKNLIITRESVKKIEEIYR